MLMNGVEVSVIIPSYREAENLRVLIPRVAAALEKADASGEIIIVDDNSPDGTDAVCAHLEQSFPLRLITRYGERGLASAVIYGLRAAKGEILIVMDADLSHPPEVIPEMVAACRSPFVDFVIGSRYAKGGSVSQSWSTYRRLNSRVASLLARGLTTARDPMAGFFALQRSRLQEGADLRPLGYKIGLELIVRCNCRRIIEVPIHFRDRVAGDSKLTVIQQWQYLYHLVRLYFAKYARFSLASRSDRIEGNTDSMRDSSKRVDRRHRPAA
jgi:dolichol-phosphate mannosyltransferase